MLALTQQAATLISKECQRRALPSTAGVRIYRRQTKKPMSVQTLVVEYVEDAEDGDTVVRHGPAAVFLAEGVDEIIGSRVLDAQHRTSPPQLLLRAQHGSSLSQAPNRDGSSR
jgi:hypothetical protein